MLASSQHSAILTSRFDDALIYASQLHAAQRRKSSGCPFVAHLLGVCSLVLEDGGDEDQAIAALLHDAVEDQGGEETAIEIERRFRRKTAERLWLTTDAGTRAQQFYAHLGWTPTRAADRGQVRFELGRPRAPCDLRDHHQRAITRLADAYRSDPRFLALIIGGSVAKGCARADSDVDFMIVANDGELRRRQDAGALFINRQDLCDYDGGYVDGKVISMDYLHEVAQRGNEPSRAAFEGAFVSYSHLPGLTTLLHRIHRYPEAGHAERIKTFYSMAFIQHWLMHEAARHNNAYTMQRAASQLALFAGRLMLAHNKRLFPYHKWLPRALAALPDLPDRFMPAFDALVAQPNAANASALFELVRAHCDWGVSDLDAYRWFMTDVEWRWRTGDPPLEDW